MRMSTSFDYRLASTPAEQYTTQGILSERIFVTVMKRSLVDPQTQTYFLNYAETARLWRRVIVVATFKGMKGVSTVSSIQATDNTEDVANVLPNAVYNLLSQLLLRTPLHRSVSRLSLTLKEDENGKLCHDASELGLAKNLVERESVAEEKILRELPDMSCPTFVESEVAVESRVSSMSYNAIVRGDRCIERKAPFATAGIDGENGFQTFLDDLKINIALRDCPGVARFVGVVLDDTRSHLRSYLHENPAVFRLSRIFIIANAESEIIPWELRELWAQQIVSAVSEIHRRGLSLGGIDIESVGVRNDGTAVLTRLHTSLSERQARRGMVAPEMRRGLCDSHNTQKPPLNNYRANIFQLGHILWLLAEHRGHTAGVFCARAACTAFPRFKCTAEHSNPVELPPCRDDIPPYFADMITRCRLPDPRLRPPARELVEGFPPKADLSLSMAQVMRWFPHQVTYYCTHCDNCGGYCRSLHYHCNICYGGDFDICPTCFEQGCRCFDPEHGLRKIVCRNDRYIDES